MGTSYLPVQWVYREVIEEEIAKGTSGKIFYFGEGEVLEVQGTILAMEETQNQGVFIRMDTEERVRIDRIITLYGKPGAAYDEYNSYADACMDCLGGYTKEELDGL